MNFAVATPNPGEPFADITDDFRRLERIMQRLQEPGGCPWDLKQTHASLKPYMVEEAYEAIDAIDRESLGDLEEELGDVLLQVVFHAVLAARTHQAFDMDSICRATARKMVRRHPHVFGEAAAADAEEVLRNWEALKTAERAEKTAAAAPPAEAEPAGVPGVLSGVPRHLPALLRAQRLQAKAARVGFDWREPGPVLDKLEEEIGEFRQALADHEKLASEECRAAMEDEFGDVLFSLVNLARWLNIDAEEALRGTGNKFQRRFEHMERRAAAENRALHEMTLEQMDLLWDEAKLQGL